MMKISKCKKELARIISEHGGWRNGEFAAQDGDGGVGGYGEKPVWSFFGKLWRNEAFGEWFVANKIKNHHQTVLSRAEYFHLYPASDANGWIEWNGGDCPVRFGKLIDVRYRDGHVQLGCRAESRCDTELYATTHWGNSGGAADIIAYRLHKPEQVETVEYNYPGVVYTGPVQSEFVVDEKPTLDQLLQDWRNADDYAQRKQAEADEAAAMRDERWEAVQARAGEMGVTVERKI